MFGIGGGELVFIIFIALMLFGSDKIPDVARTMGKAMAQLKNATNDIKSEITKSAEEHGLDEGIKNLTSGFNQEIDKIKDGLESTIPNPVDDVKKEIEDFSGPIKRQF
jgi:sec-independent protein translocase protein TatA